MSMGLQVAGTEKRQVPVEPKSYFNVFRSSVMRDLSLL